jgi:hypothetical protein
LTQAVQAGAPPHRFDADRSAACVIPGTGHWVRFEAAGAVNPQPAQRLDETSNPLPHEL